MIYETLLSCDLKNGCEVTRQYLHGQTYINNHPFSVKFSMIFASVKIVAYIQHKTEKFLSVICCEIHDSESCGI